jgi:hypothetical protein
MAQTITTTGDIPKVLEPFYLGQPGQAGLLERGIAEIFPAGRTGQEAFTNRYSNLINEGLVGRGAIAGESDYQQQVGRRLAGLEVPDTFASARQYGQDAASGLTSLQGLRASQVSAPELTQYQMGPADQVAGGTFTSPTMQAAQVEGPQMFGMDQLQQYMSPYMQGVVDVQQRKALDAARMAQLGANLGSARMGTYGGARQAVIQGAREAGLRQEMGDIQARGLQDAFSQAQQQFERDRSSTMQARLANLNAQQQANVQNLAAQLQTQGLTAEQAMRAALANQQANLTVGQQNLAASLGVQQLGAGQSLEAQRANQAADLQAAQQRAQAAQGLGTLAQGMGTLGTQQLAGELDILKSMGAYGDFQRNLEQQQKDAQRQFLTQQAEYGTTQVGQLSNLLRGIPMTDTTQRTFEPPQSNFQSLMQLGLGGIGLYNAMNPQR